MMFFLVWRYKLRMAYPVTTQRQEIADQDEAQNLYANLRGRDEIERGDLYWVVDGHYELLDTFGV